MRFYSFDEMDRDARVIAKQVRDEFMPDAIVAIARGGLTFGHALANALDMRTIFSINSIHYADTKKLDTIDVFNVPDLELYKRVLLEKFPQIELKTAVIFYKPKALIQPDFKISKTDEWINFFWENYTIEE